MLSKCANPTCTASFNYLSEGKLFEFDVDPVSGTRLHPLQVKRPVASREMFWLCGRCASELTLHVLDGEVTPVPLTRERRHVA